MLERPTKTASLVVFIGKILEARIVGAARDTTIRELYFEIHVIENLVPRYLFEMKFKEQIALSLARYSESVGTLRSAFVVDECAVQSCSFSFAIGSFPQYDSGYYSARTPGEGKLHISGQRLAFGVIHGPEASLSDSVNFSRPSGSYQSTILDLFSIARARLLISPAARRRLLVASLGVIASGRH